MRLLVDLVRTRDGSLEWSDEVVVAADSLSAGALEVTDRLVTAIALAVTEAERRRALALGKRRRGPGRVPPGAGQCVPLQRGGDDPGAGAFQRRHCDGPALCPRACLCVLLQVLFRLHRPDRRPFERGRGRAGLGHAALDADDSCPPAHWAYGRALWLKGDPAAGLRHTAHALELAPSFVQAHYMMGFIEAQSGDAQAALGHLDRAEGLSPFDPFLASIQIVRAGALMRLGDRAGAALWAARAAGHRTAYSQMLCYAALILDWAGEGAAARDLAGRIRSSDPSYAADRLFATLYALPQDVTQDLQTARGRLGL